MKNIGDHINLINDEIISRHRKIKIEPISILTRHGAPLVESRYHMPIPRRPMRRRNLREGLSLADMRRASVLQNRIQEGVARLHALRNKLVALEGKSTNVLDPLKRMLESRKRKAGMTLAPSGLRESTERSIRSNSTPPKGYIPPSQRNNPPGTTRPNQNRQTQPIKPTRPVRPSISHDPENPTPRDPQRWEEFEKKVLGNPTVGGPDNTISRISNPNNIQDQIIEEGEQDGPSVTGTDTGESTSS